MSSYDLPRPIEEYGEQEQLDAALQLTTLTLANMVASVPVGVVDRYNHAGGFHDGKHLGYRDALQQFSEADVAFSYRQAHCQKTLLPNRC